MKSLSLGIVRPLGIFYFCDRIHTLFTFQTENYEKSHLHHLMPARPYPYDYNGMSSREQKSTGYTAFGFTGKAGGHVCPDFQ